MIPNIDFENVSHSEAEKMNLRKFRELHEKDYLPLTLKIWITFFAVGALTMALLSAVILNADWIDTNAQKAIKYINDLPWPVTLACGWLVVAFLIWYVVDRQAKQQRG